MEYLIGVVLAVIITAFALAVGFDRDRAFYPTVLIVIASYYVLFAVMGASTHVMIMESVVATLFLFVAAAGFKVNLWLVAAALAGHGIFDFFHHLILQNAGVPVWWPGFCLSFDVAAAVWLAAILVKRPGLAQKV